MINMNQEYVTQYVKNLCDDQAQRHYELDLGDFRIDDIYDLHDYTIESQNICQIDRVYDCLFAMLPLIFDDIVDYIDEMEDLADDVWGTYAMRETIGLCD